MYAHISPAAVSQSGTHTPYTRTHMHILARRSDHSVSTTLRHPGASSSGPAKTTRALLGSEGTAWSLSLPLHRRSTAPAAPLLIYTSLGSGCPRPGWHPGLLGGRWWQLVPGCGGGHPGLPSPPPASLPCLCSGCPHEWPISFFSCMRGHSRRELKKERE